MYKTFEQKIQELWAAHGLEVLQEQYHPNDDDTETWVIKAKRKRK